MALVAAHTEVRESLKEAGKALLENIHLWEEQLWILFDVDVAVELSEGLPEAGTAPLAELAVENENGSSDHHLSKFAQIAKEGLFQLLRVVNVHGTLYMAISELIIEPAVHDNDWMCLASHQVCQGLAIDRVASG